MPTLGARELRRGMRGRDVEDLILLLVRRGYLKANNIPNENLFDVNVEVSVKAFQRAMGLPETGVVNYRTSLMLKVGGGTP